MVLDTVLMLRTEDATFDSSHCAMKIGHVPVIGQSFDLEASINDCTVNELVFTLLSTFDVKIPIEMPMITTSKLGLLVGTDLVTKFGSGAPCQLIFSFPEVPQFKKHYDATSSDGSYWMLENTPLSMDIKC